MGTATSVKNRLKFSSDWAGKTGTSQDYKDTWFVATNPNVSFGFGMAMIPKIDGKHTKD